MRRLMTSLKNIQISYETSIVIALAICVVVFVAQWMHTFYG
jgi:preprotein translocase subunit Sec61beta